MLGRIRNASWHEVLGNGGRNLKHASVWARGALLATCLCSLAAPVTSADPGSEEAWERTTAQWFETVPADGTIDVINPHGNVYARCG